MERVAGFLNVHKPAGITSHDVVYKLRNWTKIKRIGHAGTLDPDATGVLPIAIGSVSRLISYLSNEKIYLAEILLGTSTTTDDLSGAIIRQSELPLSIDTKRIESVLHSFIGQSEQKPPVYSAVQKNGQRLYNLARKRLEDPQNNATEQSQMTETVNNILANVESRSINIKNIEILQLDLPVLQLRIACSSGTYIRSIARDIGQALGCGACLRSLCREQSGIFSIEKAIPLPRIQELVKARRLQEILLSPQEVLQTKVINLELADALLISQGRSLAIETINSNFFSDNYESSNLQQYCLAVYSNHSIPVSSQTIALCSIIKNKLVNPKIVLIDPQNLINQTESNK